MIYTFKTIISAMVSVIMSMVLTFSSSLGLTSKPAEKTDDFDGVKNVILMIGDGMGPLQLEKTKQERNISLVMDAFPLQGWSMTKSKSSSVTDSAAGATALSCGVRTYNGAIGVNMSDPLCVDSKPMNITELCMARGMKTGIVTTDLTSGATPAGFSSHTYSRSNEDKISQQQMESGIDLIWGSASESVTASECEANGFTYVSSYSELNSLEEGSRSFAQFTNDLWHTEQTDSETPTLSQMTVKAIDLLDDSDDGFFMMIEGAHIDKNNHANNGDGMTDALHEFDNAVAQALSFAEKDGHTLVIITADHESGGLTQNADGTYSYTSTGHTGVDVPVRVYGSSDFISQGETLNNYEIPQRIAYSLGFSKTQFPKENVNWWLKN